MTILAIALAVAAVAWAAVTCDLGRRFLTWAAAREQRLDADGHRAALAAVEARVAKIERDEMDARRAGSLTGRR